MKQEYQAYLAELLEEKRASYVNGSELTAQELVYAACNSFTTKFVKKFPHLKRQAGFYGSGRVAGSPGSEHWWCVDVDGTIVDPTAAQFLPGGVYTPLDPSKHDVKLGRCMNCGADIYGKISDGSKCVCSQDCADALENYYNGLLK